MSGVPVYTSSPINANTPKASGVTPKTQTDPSRTGPTPATTTASTTSAYPPAKPGAAAVPAPTGTAQRYAPIQPTPTTTVDSEAPPPPQPGAAPIPFKSTIPPPKFGEKYNPPPQPQTIPQPYPPQMGIPPPPTSAYGSQVPPSSTSTTTIPSAAYPVPLPSAQQAGPRSSMEHPPGYHQNTYASELTSDQRRAQAANDSSISGGGSEGFDTGMAWNTAKEWLGNAGTKLSEAEQEIWRKIGKE